MVLQVAYETGVHHYNMDDYQQAVTKLEESLQEGLLALEDCRALCEGPQEEDEEENEEKIPLGLFEAIAGSPRSLKRHLGLIPVLLRTL